MPRTTQELTIEVAQQRELLQIQRGNLHHLRLQEAKYGIDTPVLVKNQIEQTEQHIRHLDEQIAHLELEATDIARTESQAAHERQLVEAFLEQRAGSAGVTTARPLALAICLIPNLRSIKVDVEAFLEAKGWPMPVEEITLPGINGDSDIARLVVEIRQKKLAIQERGYTEVHLFMAGPIIAGVAVGGIFDNWKPVKLYHRAGNTPTQSYEYWMPLLGM